MHFLFKILGVILRALPVAQAAGLVNVSLLAADDGSDVLALI